MNNYTIQPRVYRSRIIAWELVGPDGVVAEMDVMPSRVRKPPLLLVGMVEALNDGRLRIVKEVDSANKE